MILGPIKIIICIKCDTLETYRTIISGNTFGAVMWTDGFMEVPMLYAPPELIRCSGCSYIYWLKKSKVIGSMASSEIRKFDSLATPLELAPEEWKEAKEVSEPSASEYYNFIEKSSFRKKQMIQLRLLAWWKRNENYRKAKFRFPYEMTSELWTANLEALLTLFTGNSIDHCLYQAEILRELGRFEESVKVLRSVKDYQTKVIVKQLVELCKNENRIVQKVKNSFIDKFRKELKAELDEKLQTRRQKDS